jgi:hypothetical protein
VPHFAELQQNGYQVVHGSKDLLVFKKLKEIGVEERVPSLADHGLFKSADTQAEPITNLVVPRPSNKTGHHAFNPIDGTAHVEETGRYPSRWDDLVSQAEKSAKDDANDYDIKHYPRVRREERVFSGRKKAGRGSRHDSAGHNNEDALRKKYGWGSRIRWALAVGFGASAVAYGVGAVVERKELKDKERWEQLMKANNRRW